LSAYTLHPVGGLYTVPYMSWHGMVGQTISEGSGNQWYSETSQT